MAVVTMSRRVQDKEKAQLIKAVMLDTHAQPYEMSHSLSRSTVDCDQVYENLFIGDRYNFDIDDIEFTFLHRLRAILIWSIIIA